MSAFSQCASDFVHHCAAGAERTTVREHLRRTRMCKMWRAVGKSLQKKFICVDPVKTRVKFSNYKPVLDLGCNLISEIINFRNGKVSLLSDRKIEDRATYEQSEKDTGKYRIK